MRIIAGKWRSRKLVWPDTPDTRPMPDRVRETIFSILGSRYGTPGEIPPVRVADVFAGTGSMGLEALSRGAASCVFFERGKAALQALRRNLDTLEAGPEAVIVMRDAWRESLAAEDGRPFDLVFLDPPYRDSQDASRQGRVAEYMARLSAQPDRRPLVLLHHHQSAKFEAWPDLPWLIVDRRKLGTNVVTFFSR